MDFLDPIKRRQHRKRLVIGYFLMVIVVLEVSYLLFLMSTGLGIDRRTGQVIQNGFVFVSSHPVSAQTYVDNQLKGNTSLKVTLPEGRYNFLLKSHGYRDWTSVVNLVGGGVEQLDYPLLIPLKLTQKDIHLYAKSPGLTTTSPDRHWLVVLQPGSLTDFDVFDLTNPTATPTVLKIPSSILQTEPANQLIKAVEWSSDNKHLLLEHDFKGGKEFIMVDRTNAANIYNLNQLMNIAPDKVTLKNKKADQMYAHIAKTKALISVNTTTKQLSTTLQNVLDFMPNGGNTIIYTSDLSTVANRYSVNIWDGQKSYLLHNYPVTSYLLDMAQYSGDTYVAVTPVSSGRVYIYKNPLNIMKTGKVPNPFIALKINNPQVMSFSDNSRFIGAQSGSAFAVYDFDSDLWHYFTLKEKVPTSDRARWMDGHRFTLNIGGVINIFDFNGGNQQTLVPSNPDSNGYFDRNYSHLFTMAPSVKTPNSQALTSTSLVVGK